MQKIVMTDGVAMLIEETVTDVVALEEFRRAIGTTAISTPILPFGCVYYHEKRSKQIFLVVRRAEIREVNQANVIFKVAMPHRLYSLSFKGGNLLGVDQNIMLTMPTRPDTPVFEAPLPNRVKGGNICRTGLMIAGAEEPIPFRIDHIINQVERTRHNTDHISYAKECMPTDFSAEAEGVYTRMLAKWAEWTTAHEDDWESRLSEISWVPNGTLAKQMGGFDG